jgi:prepilin-type N-terminal cleavage/methylation domain-containing protein
MILKTIDKDTDKNSQNGFTIVELLIATLVFSIILVIITSGILVFSRAYFRGINSSGLQTVARTASEDIGQAVQFSGSNIVEHSSGATPYYVCAGNFVYFYTLYAIYPGGTPTAANIGIWRQPLSTDCSITTPIFNAGTGSQLLSKSTRVAKFLVNPVVGVNGAFTIDIKLAFGSDDGFFSNPGNASVQCIGQAGDEYCSVAELNTVVQKRV